MSIGRIGCWVAGGAAVVVLAWAPAMLRAQPECVSAPDEPNPLPTVRDADPTAAAFATRRITQLARRARRLEQASPDAAHAAWRRVLCFDPDNPSARAALGAATPEPSTPDDEPPSEDAPAEAALETVVAEPAPTADPIAPAERALRAARFAEAVAAADAIRSALPEDDGAGGRALRVRLELVAAAAQVGLGDSAAARAAIERALAADPLLVVDERSVSPRVVRLWREVDTARLAPNATGSARP